MLFHLMVHFLTNFYSQKTLLVFWTAGALLLIGNHFSSSKSDIFSVISALTLSLMNPCLAALEPESVSLAQNLNSVTLLIAYVMIDMDSIANLAVILINVGAWSIYWLFYKNLICAEGIINREPDCLEARSVILHFVANALMALNCFGLVKYKAMLLNRSKQDNNQLAGDLKSCFKSNSDLHKKIELNDSFLMAYSHELKNPLNALLCSIELAQEESNPTELRFLLSSAEMSGRMLLHLLTNVLDSGKIQVSKLEINYQSMNFVKYIENSWQNISTLIKSKGLQGSLTIQRDFPSQVFFDPHRLSQILLNLVSNSIKFTEKGHIKLFLSFEEADELPIDRFKTITFGKNSADFEEMNYCNKNNPRTSTLHRNPLNSQPLSFDYRDCAPVYEAFQLDFTRKCFPPNYFAPQKREKKGFIRVEVVDTGCGMNSEQSSSLFQRFTQVNEDSSKRQAGTGLGLWIAKELCMRMQGDIKVSSQEGVGTSFVAIINANGLSTPFEQSLRIDTKTCDNISNNCSTSPTTDPKLLDKRDSLSIGRMSSVSSLLPPKKVLLAEDLIYNQEIMIRMLKKDNIEAVVCSNGKEAVKAFKAAPPNYFNFLLFDLNMPELDGISASEMIRAHEAENSWKQSHIFILTGLCPPETRSRCLEAKGPIRATEVLLKPLSQAEIRRVSQLVDN